MTEKEKNTDNFNSLGIKKSLLEILLKRGFTAPTPIQHQVIPGALEGKDVIGIAQTGTGKTLAFIVPIVQRIIENNGQGLILTPTRELAVQIEQVFKQVGSPLGLRSSLVIGGVSKHKQIKSLKDGPHVVIATPGRLKDLINQRSLNLNKVSIVVLDEADRMLDIGFLPEIKKILQLTPNERQTMLFSATMPESISFIAGKFMKMPIRIEIAPQGTLAKNVEQELFIVSKEDKNRLLDLLLNEYKDKKVLIFSRTKHGAKRIARDVRNMGHPATEIHSNRSQPQRRTSLEGFVSGRFNVMVATDIASRGIDVKDISLVVNFDLPDDSEDYVHRIGRTGRAGKHGKAVSFATSNQRKNIKKIERLIRKTLPVSSLPDLPPERKRVNPDNSRNNDTKRNKYGKKRNFKRNNRRSYKPRRSSRRKR